MRSFNRYLVTGPNQKLQEKVMPYGFDDSDWETAKTQAKEILADRGRVRGMMAYTELTQRISALSLHYHEAGFNHFLREISVEEHAQGRGMMTALVVYKKGSMEPRPGFYDLAEELGLDTTKIDACWTDQLHRVHRGWAG